MTLPTLHQPDPKLDLVLERIVDVPRELVWMAWTTPEQMGQEFPHVCCYLEVITNEEFVWTDALAPGFRPSNRSSEIPSFTAVITLEPHGKGTKYTALAMHRDEEGRNRHNEMGFHDGWGKVFDQLVDVVKRMQVRGKRRTTGLA